MRLWLDDVRPMPPDFDVHVRTAGEAKSLVLGGQVRFISFDNDLGPSDAGEGYQVADLIEELAFLGRIPPMGWAVHSANPVRRDYIVVCMGNAERAWSSACLEPGQAEDPVGEQEDDHVAHEERPDAEPGHLLRPPQLTLED